MDVHDVAAAIMAPTLAVPAVRLRWGVVTAVALDGTLTVEIGGSTTAVSGIVALDHVTAVATNTVALITDGVDMFAIGTGGA